MNAKRMRFGRGYGVVGCLLILVGIAVADAQSDLDSRKRDLDSAKREVDSVRSDITEYLRDSREIRALDADLLDKLITAFCGSDIERDGDEAMKLAKEMTKRAKESVEKDWNDLDREFGDVVGELEDLLDDLKGLRNSVSSIPEEDPIKSDRQALLDEIGRVIDSVDRAMAEVQNDHIAASNVKQGTMQGSNNPRIRAAMEHGKVKHQEMQRDCHASEVVLRSGRPDCVMFDNQDCKVIEFKPDSVGDSVARSQAEGYLADVQVYFKDDERAKKNCKVDSSGVHQYTAVSKTYPACKLR
jgi:hypothetical protein